MNHGIESTRWIRSTQWLRVMRLFTFVPVLGIVAAAPPSSARMLVYTVNYPLAYFAERVGGDAVAVQLPAPAQVDPAFWKPTPEIIAEYQGADLILANGAGFAQWISQASLPRRKLVDTSRSFRDAYLPSEKTSVHQHGPGGEHTHGETAFTTWLDPKQAIAQTREIETTFAKRRPEDRPGFASRADAFVIELERLDCELAATLAAFADEPLLASHPVYPYLARRYGLDLHSVTWEPDRDPGDTSWETFDTLLSEHPAHWMLWESTPLESTREKLAARGVGVIVFETASNRPARGNYLSVMDENLRELRLAAGLPDTRSDGCDRSR
jgi:zinc transport system substrate-binding protein